MKILSNIARTTRDSKRNASRVQSNLQRAKHNSQFKRQLSSDIARMVLHVIMYRRVFASKPLYVYHNSNPICVHNNKICVHTLMIVYEQRILIDFCRGKNTSHFSSSFSSKYIIEYVYFNRITQSTDLKNAYDLLRVFN